jgi:hypothetical protein
MPAWEHKYGWRQSVYDRYRLFVRDTAKSLEGDDHDCADLSIMLIVQFAAKHNLCLTFRDGVDGMYISKASGMISGPLGGPYELSDDITWNSQDEYLHVVQKRTSAKDLIFRNTRPNSTGPTAGDLMLRYKAADHWYRDNSEGHAALVFYYYDVGVPCEDKVKNDERTYPSYPGDDKAKADFQQTKYFRGDVDENNVTISRELKPPFDKDLHFNYLNSRSNKKRNAELIYFANARQLKEDGFDFYEYNLIVTDNWKNWDGTGVPPRSHQWPEYRDG